MRRSKRYERYESVAETAWKVRGRKSGRFLVSLPLSLDDASGHPGRQLSECIFLYIMYVCPAISRLIAVKIGFFFSVSDILLRLVQPHHLSFIAPLYWPQPPYQTAWPTSPSRPVSNRHSSLSALTPFLSMPPPHLCFALGLLHVKTPASAKNSTRSTQQHSRSHTSLLESQHPPKRKTKNQKERIGLTASILALRIDERVYLLIAHNPNHQTTHTCGPQCTFHGRATNMKSMQAIVNAAAGAIIVCARDKVSKFSYQVTHPEPCR